LMYFNVHLADGDFFFVVFDHRDESAEQAILVHAARVDQLAVVVGHVRAAVAHIGSAVGHDVRRLNDADALHVHRIEHLQRVTRSSIENH